MAKNSTRVTGRSGEKVFLSADIILRLSASDMIGFIQLSFGISRNVPVLISPRFSILSHLKIIASNSPRVTFLSGLNVPSE
mgnify:CR=1 FL=1